MKYLMFIVALVLTGCDTDADDPVLLIDLQLLTTTCERNGGFQSAQRALPAFSGTWEWRVKCGDGAQFVKQISYAAVKA